MAHQYVCGCWFNWIDPKSPNHLASINRYLPQVKLRADTSILVTTSRTKLQQTFVNDTGDHATEVRYTFPLYDGVSVVSFKCTVDGKVILGIVKEREEARQQYEDAVARGQSAGLFEQSLDASDVFTTRIGNVPNGAEAEIEIEYIGELKHDAELDGVRFTIPTSIAPRYGDQKKSGSLFGSWFNKSKTAIAGSIDISVDVMVEEGAHIEGLTSPSHPIAMKLGRTSTQSDRFRSNLAHATLALGSAELDKDFVVVVHAQGHEIPRALLERHPSIPNRRALMATLVPKFNLPNNNAEIVFVVDRSGSMQAKMSLVVEALKLFLRSLPYSAKFNIASFGTRHNFLFPKSQAYDEQSAQTALDAIQQFQANMGGTEMLTPLQAVVKNRLPGVPLEIMLLTDGQVWNQQQMFDYINGVSKSNVRLFSLGIGDGASTSQIEGLARAGNGFAQFAKDGEKVDKRLMRMLKAALSPHINDYHLEVAYAESTRNSRDSSGDDDFEMIEAAAIPDRTVAKPDPSQSAPISLIDANFTETAPNTGSGRYDHLPKVMTPKEVQAPCEIGGLFSFNRTSVYLLLADTPREIKSVALVGSFNGTPLRLDIPVQDVGAGQTIHQLAAKKAMLEVEEGRGWLSSTTSKELQTLRNKHKADWDKVIEREAARLGTQFQVAGKFCSFVAVDTSSDQEKSEFSENIVTKQRPKPRDAQASQVFRRRQAFRNMSVSSPPSQDGQALPQFQQQQQQQQQMSYSIPPPPPMRSMNPGSNQSPLFGSGAAPPPPAPRMQVQAAAYAPPAFGSATAFASAAPAGTEGGDLFSSVSSSQAPPTGNAEAMLFGGMQPMALQQQQQNSKEEMSASSPSPLKKSRTFNIDNCHEECEAEPEVSAIVVDSMVDASTLADEKRKRNPGASARFRARRKEKDPSSRQNIIHRTTSDDPVHALIDLQRFDGSWQLTDQLLQFTGVKKQGFANASFGYDDENIKATLLALAWFEKQKKGDKEIWEMIAEKAKNWLSGQQGVADTDALVSRAIGVFFP